MKLTKFILLFFVFTVGVYPQNSYFYKGYDYGNQALFNPVYAIINGGFDMMQVGGRRNLNDLQFGSGLKNVLKNLGDPFKVINHCIGVFYDRNNSLLASLSLSFKTDYWANLNIYPGIIKFDRFSPGLWLAYNEDKKMVLGITFNWFPMGIA
jgi:hypothetical protein